jgi:uncharacterized heparinase superfamily protein
MGPVEIASRVRQGLAKRADSLGLFQPRFESLSAPVLTASGRFFFATDEIPRRIDLIRENVPGFEREVLDQADRLLDHRFSLLGYGPLDYGKDIDWQLDIVSGIRCPLKPWPRINYQDFGEVGDSKVTAELSRHQFLVTLAKARLLTGKEVYLRKLESIYYDWHRKNPYPLGLNWTSSLEVAFRSLSWIWVRELLAGCAAAARLRRDIALALAFNGWYMRRYLSTYFSPNTHVQGEAVALFFIGTLLPSLPKASDWRETGRKILREHALSKVLADGAYFEQSTYYHVYAVDFFLHARVLAECNLNPFPGDYDAVLTEMLKYLSFLCQSGPPPCFGDDDGGRVFDPSRNRAEHLCDPLAIGTAMYRLDILKRPGVCVTEEMIWLLGEQGLRAFSGCREWNTRSSAKFPHTGIYVSDAGDASRSQVVMDAGPLGGGSGGHGHADALSLTLNVDGKPLLVDPGACVYFGPGSERERFRTTQAHNTLTVDRLSQAEPRALFSWFRWPEVTIETVAFTPEFDFIAASHDGYARLQPPATHRRTLFTPREGFWFVLDELASDGPHDCRLHWHLAPGAEINQQGADGWIVDLEGSALQLLTAADGWRRTVEADWFSPSYGQKQAASVLTVTKDATSRESIATVLWTGALQGRGLALTALSDSSGMPAYCITTGAHRSMFLFGDGVSTLQVEGWESDARFLYGIVDADGMPLRLISVHSRFVRHKGMTLHESAQKVEHYVWTRPASR